MKISLRILIPAVLFLGSLRADPDNQVVLRIQASPPHPRNSEAGFVTLKSGRIELYYSQYYGGSQDESPARIAEVHSDDGGRSWSDPKPAIENGANQNIMDVSFVRLASGKIALMYNVRKIMWLDCRPVIRLSSDEGASWSEPVPVIVAPGYIGTNNDRFIQTRRGRLVVPLPFNRLIGTANAASSVDWRAITCWYLSDDEGATWRESPTWWTLPVPSAVGMDEPGVVELADGSLYSWARTDHGEQWACRSTDGGETWSPPQPTPLISPNSPASIKRLPHSDQLLAIYNDHSGRPAPARHTFGDRTPLVAAISFDGARTWPNRKTLEDEAGTNFCYTAVHFVDDAVLLAYGVYRDDHTHRAELRVRRLALSWLPR